jgi:DNA-binding NarL/FixJ family response regulator
VRQNAWRANVLIIDDHQDFRGSARVLLDAEGLDVVGVTGDAEPGLAEVGRLQPDLVLLDIQLLGTDRFAAADRVAMMASLR